MGIRGQDWTWNPISSSDSTLTSCVSLGRLLQLNLFLHQQHEETGPNPRLVPHCLRLHYFEVLERRTLNCFC